ncbi:MAG TPA: glycoside hydrolase family 3 N-terminal domain-containing protein, partial [Cytophagales bacterium]|nr:glycoside hydrolase family 3 N-terminal domain-containing protein [Cytophagales bacterium]
MLRYIKYFLTALSVMVALSAKAEDTVRRPKNKRADKWVDSIYSTMTQHERIGQLFMIAAYSNKDSAHIKEIDSLIIKYKIGGLIFMQGGPLRQMRLTNRYQSLSKIPLFIAIDGEWGLSMRLDSTIVFPKQMTMGALSSDKLIYDFGKEVGYQCKRMGIHINFAPVVDVNNNRMNPVIGYRSFGEDVEKVTLKATQYMRGMQSQGVLACAKHFPGHGDTDSDSHLSLPVIKHKKSRLDDVELYPFKKMIDDTLASIMVAHLYVPALDDEENRATTLSEKVVRKLLKNKLGFKGLIFTDALNMKGVSSYYAPGEVDKLAFKAGNDVLLFSQDVPKALRVLDSAILNKEIDEERLEESVKKILYYKYKVGLNHYKQLDTTHLIKDLNNGHAQALREEVYRKAVTLVKNEKNLIPIKEVSRLKMACVVVGNEDDGIVASSFRRYAAIDYFFVDKKNELTQYQKLWDKV